MIIGICGLIGSGKGTVADMLQDQGFLKVSWADSLKDAVAAIFCWPRHLLEGDTEQSRSWREQVDPWWENRLGIQGLSPRWVLQQWGTEVCRENFHRDIWIASMERKLANHTSNIVIPDTRFPNEIEMIQKMGGKVWQVKRGEDPQWFRDYVEKGIEPVDIHPSEWQWSKSAFDETIYNNSDLDSLLIKVKSLV